MGQELKIRHCVLKIKVNTNLIVRTDPNKAYIILQLKFYHHSGSSNSESQFQVLTLQVQVQVQVLAVQVQVQVQVLGLRVQVQSKSSRNRTRVRLESKSRRTRVLQLCCYISSDMKCANSDTEPLAFWQQHSRRFPKLSKLAVQNCTLLCFQQCSQQLQLVSF